MEARWWLELVVAVGMTAGGFRDEGWVILEKLVAGGMSTGGFRDDGWIICENLWLEG